MATEWNKHFIALTKKIDTISNGEIAILHEKMDETTNPFLVIKPKDGPLKFGHFEFEIKSNDQYPQSAPEVVSKTKIYHPNIEDGSICFSLLDEWEETYDLIDVAMGLLYLIKNPQLDDPLNSEFNGDDDFDDFEKMAVQSILGDLDGYTRNVHEVDGEIPNEVPKPEEPEAELQNTVDKDKFTPNETPILSATNEIEDKNVFDRISGYRKLFSYSTLIFGVVVVTGFIILKMMKHK